MTTPAVDVREVNRTQTSCIRLWDGTTQITDTVNSSVWARKRPASVNSPKRGDGTRGPRSFSHTGVSEFLPIATCRYSEDVKGTKMRLWQGILPDVSLPTNRAPPGLGPATLRDRCNQAALKSAKNSKVNLGQALAEARQTARLVGSTAEKIGHMVNAFKSKNPKKVWDLVKRGGRGIPSSYLEMCYGWSPLLQDVLGSAEALAEAQNLGRRFNLTVHGNARDSSAGELLMGAGSSLRLRYRSQTTYRGRTSLTYSLPAGILPTLSSVGLTNPIELAWELVPYSFVVDWFLPIGNWLHLLDAGSYLTFREGSYSVISRTNAVSRYELPPSSGYRYNHSCSTIRAGGIRGFNFSRSVLLTPPRVPLPSLRSPLSLGNMAKGLSLLATAFDRKGPSWAKQGLRGFGR